ncbi:hypothetical protein M758_5G131100 [Ceratodon purpureus]|nr:hypothetical protein M758_5G131100 [Ceratodon purpureus]
MQLQASGKAKHRRHHLYFTQYDYDNWLAKQTGSAPMEPWRGKMDRSFLRFRREKENFRPRSGWVPEELLLKIAHGCLRKMQSLKVGCT